MFLFSSSFDKMDSFILRVHRFRKFIFHIQQIFTSLLLHISLALSPTPYLCLCLSHLIFHSFMLSSFFTLLNTNFQHTIQGCFYGIFIKIQWDISVRGWTRARWKRNCRKTTVIPTDGQVTLHYCYEFPTNAISTTASSAFNIPTFSCEPLKIYLMKNPLGNH